jgi:Tol biopolymer transport system component
MRNRQGLLALAFVVVIVAAGCDIVRVSVSTSGAQGNGQSQNVSLSADAGLVAFDSDATNLVPGDTNGWSDVFVRDTKHNTTTRISGAPDGGTANGASTNSVISADGKFVAFRSAATNLVPGAPTTGIYLRDLTAGTTTLVSKDANGAAIGLTIPDGIAISSTGRFVVFLGGFQVYRYDRQTNAATMVLNETREPTGISTDGRYFASDTITLVGTHSEVAAVIDLTTQTAPFAGPADSWGTRISTDGKWVVYAFAPNCFPGGFPSCTAGPSGARLRNVATGQEYPVVTSLGLPAVRVTSIATSDDGNRIALTMADNAYLFNRPTGVFTLVTSAKSTPETGDAPTTAATISADGTTVGFATAATNLVDQDTNGVGDVFIRKP